MSKLMKRWAISKISLNYWVSSRLTYRSKRLPMQRRDLPNALKRTLSLPKRTRKYSMGIRKKRCAMLIADHNS
jgi:hypothetical protein